jgi:hypothetical protein
VTTRSPLGALASQTAGLFLDGGWLRHLGAGGPARLQRWPLNAIARIGGIR